MMHLNPFCKKWKDLNKKETKWLKKAVEKGGVLEKLIAKEGRFEEVPPDFDSLAPTKIYRIRPDYWIARDLCRIETEEIKQASGRKKKKKSGSKKSKNKKSGDKKSKQIIDKSAEQSVPSEKKQARAGSVADKKTLKKVTAKRKQKPEPSKSTEKKKVKAKSKELSSDKKKVKAKVKKNKGE